MQEGFQRGDPALLSGNWNNLSNASTFNWNLNNATSNVNRNIGTHLANFVKLSLNLVRPCPLAKHNNEKPCAGRISGNLERSRPIQRTVPV
jgi:hypothetical protein